MASNGRFSNFLHVLSVRIIRRSAISATSARYFLWLIRIAGLSFGLRVLIFLFRVLVTTYSNHFSATNGIRVIILRRGRVRRPSAVISASASFGYFFLSRTRTQDHLAHVRCTYFHSFRYFSVFTYHNYGAARTLRSVRRRTFHLRRELCLAFSCRDSVTFLRFNSIISRYHRFRVQVRYIRGAFDRFSPNRCTIFLRSRLTLPRFHDQGAAWDHVITVACVFYRYRTSRFHGRLFFYLLCIRIAISL